MRREIARHFGSDLAYPNREAVIYKTENHYEVDFIKDGKVIETREMITQYQDLEEPTVHSMQYAEDAAENYCLGYIPADGRRTNDT
tara:strand:- start:265 stop:522 length:258 start_codon:yes stop_codon:yes gene_type:complete